MNETENVISYIQDLCDDDTMPKNIKQKLFEFIEVLKNKEELTIKIDKILCDLEEISNDVNIPSFVRTQLWNISSMLESLASNI
ncbi:MAG: UPF0147 family protein [Candidatus Woesearchaeota archaeon]